MTASKAEPAGRPGTRSAVSEDVPTTRESLRVVAIDVSKSVIEKIRSRTGAEIIETTFSSLTLNLLAQWTPDAVFAPLLGPDVDIVELAQWLQKFSFGGQLYAVTGPVPDTSAIIEDVRSHCPGISFDVVMFRDI